MSQSTDPPSLRLVSLHDPSGFLEAIETRPETVRPRFAPIADIARGGAAGYEVLLSIGPDGAAAPPCEWSRHVHEDSAGRLEARLLACALAEREHLPADTRLAVNLSAAALRSAEVADALQAAGPLSQVMLIVTEDAADDPDGRVASVVDGVREAGGMVAVDETGSGYASLRHVLDLRPDLVRVGAAFVAGIDRDEAKGAVVEAVVSLSERTGARVIAGGIPGRQELSALRRMGVQLGMGPLFGSPAAAMGPLSDTVAEAIRKATPPVAPGETVAALIEARPAMPWGSSIEAVADAFLEDPLNDVIVLVDERSRPLALAERAALMRGEPHERPVMRISPTSPQKAIARRAAARPWLERFHPLVACDGRGVYLGLVRVEQLLDALAQE